MPVPSQGHYVSTVFRLFTDFVCLYNYEFGLSLCKIAWSWVILLLPLLSASLDCHFWIALWYSLMFSNRRLTFFPNCIWTPTFSTKHNNLASVVWHTCLRIVVCPFVPLLSFFGPVYYLSFFDLRIAITLWYISPVTYVRSSLLVDNKYVVPYFLHSHK